MRAVPVDLIMMSLKVLRVIHVNDMNKEPNFQKLHKNVWTLVPSMFRREMKERNEQHERKPSNNIRIHTAV